MTPFVPTRIRACIALLVLCAVLAERASGQPSPDFRGDDAARPAADAYSLAQIVAGLTKNLKHVGNYESKYQVILHDPDGRKRYFEEVLTWKYDPEGWPSRIEPRRYERWQYPNIAAMAAARASAYDKVIFDGQGSLWQSTTYRWDGKESTRVSRHQGLHDVVWGRGLTLADLAGRRLDVEPVERLLKNGTFQIEQLAEHDGRRLIVLYGKLVGPDSNDKAMTTPGTYVRFWLDPSRGYMPVRREEFAITSGQSKPNRHTVVTAELEEVTPGVWFPKAGTWRTDSQRAALERVTIDLNVTLNHKVWLAL